MSELKMPASLVAIADRGRITGDDVKQMRREFFGDHLIERKEVEAMLALDRSISDKCTCWQTMLEDAFLQYLLEQPDNKRSMTQDDAEWFARCIQNRGLVDSPELFATLVKVLEYANDAPEFLQEMALKQVSLAVLNNQGPVCKLRPDSTEIICQSDVELIRRVLFAGGGDGGLAVTRMEAEFLFDLNDKTNEMLNHASWSDLFVKAIGSHLLATLGDAVPRRDASLAAMNLDDSGSLWDSLVAGLRSVYSSTKSPHSQFDDEMGKLNERIEEKRAQAAKVDDEEARWVENRIGRDGLVHENERALLRFIKEERGELPQRLDDLVAA